MSAEVVHDQEGRRAYLLEASFKCRSRVVIRETQVVQQIRDSQEQGRNTHTDRKVSDCSREVGFTTAIIPLDEQPTVERSGKQAGLVIGLLQGISLQWPQTNAAVGLEVLKSQVCKLIQVAEFIKVSVNLLADLPMPAGTNLQLPEIGMTYRQILAQITQTLTMGTVWVTWQIIDQVILLHVRRRSISWSRPPTLHTGGELFQCRVDLLAHLFLFPASGPV